MNKNSRTTNVYSPTGTPAVDVRIDLLIFQKRRETVCRVFISAKIEFAVGCEPVCTQREFYG